MLSRALTPALPVNLLITVSQSRRFRPKFLQIESLDHVSRCLVKGAFMDMSQKLVSVLAASCGLAAMAAIWTVMSGYGILAGFLVYSFGGATLVIGLSAVTAFVLPQLRRPQQIRLEQFQSAFADGEAEARMLRRSVA